MLVIISDIHLTDGLSGETVRMPAFRELRQRLRDLAYEASWRVPVYGDDGKIADYTYKPIEEMHLLLLGDILDIIRSPTWLDGDARPWSETHSPGFIERVKGINDGILKNNAESLAILKRLSEGVAGEDVDPDPKKSEQYKGLLKLTKRGFRGDDEQQVKVHIHYMIGNHDWFYHLPGKEYDAIRKSVVKAMGLANDPSEPFPHDPGEQTRSAAAIREVLEEHRVFARHGDKFDKFNFDSNRGRDASSLGDAIVVELLGRFPVKVEEACRAGRLELPEEVLRDFRELDNVKPYAVIPGWIVGLLDRAGLEPEVERQVKKIWNDVADDFLDLDFVKEYDQPWWKGPDTVDWMQLVLKLAEGASLGKINELALKYYTKAGSKPETYHEDALKEEAFANSSADFIVYGHTHDHEVVPLKVRPESGGVQRTLYINSGTWRRVHRLSQDKTRNLEFFDFNVMTYLAFYKRWESNDRRFATWSGALGLDRNPKSADVKT